MNPPAEHRSRWRLLALFGILVAGVVATSIYYYRGFERQFRVEVENQLTAVANLKVSELAQYRRQRDGDANMLFQNPAIDALVRRFREKPEDAEAQAQLRILLKKFQFYGQYDLVGLLDPQGALLLAATNRPVIMSATVLEHVPEALRTDRIIYQDFYRDEHDQRIYLALVIPIFDPGEDRRPLGVFLLHIDPETYLYPFISRWPTASRTAETLLVRRDGNEAVFLNTLRFQTNTALNRRYPMDRTNTPAVQAAAGAEGIMEGRDYRGVPVVAATRTVPGSPWALVARMDTEEVYAPLRERFWQVILLATVLLLGLATGVSLVLRRRRLQFYQAQAAAAATLQASLDRLQEAQADLKRSNQELEQFAYIASHDLQEPLRMVSSYTQLLAQRYEGQLDEKARKFINYAVDGSQRMQTLINDLLTYSRIGIRGQPPEPTDAHAALGDALANLAISIRESQAIITNDDLPTVSVDPTQLVQVFQNLLANAIKFRQAATPRIHVSARDAGPEWVFSVQDNGIGIEPQHAERTFVIFQRLHTRAEYPGTGIGLAVCKRIAERHGGKIWLTSVPGTGTTFFFTVPKPPRNCNPKVIVSSSPGLPSPRGYPGLASVRFSTPTGLCPLSATGLQPRWAMLACPSGTMTWPGFAGLLRAQLLAALDRNVRAPACHPELSNHL